MIKCKKIKKVEIFLFNQGLLIVDKYLSGGRNMKELIKQAQNGDEKAFNKIFIEINDDLYKIAKSRINNEDDIADAVQETMIETFRSIKKLRDPCQFKKWVITILINKCNRIYRRKYKKDVSYEEYNFEYFSSSCNLESNIEFYEMLKDLKYEEKIIIILYYLEQYTVKDIKKILKMNENTVTTHLYRARQKIKNKLEK